MNVLIEIKFELPIIKQIHASLLKMKIIFFLKILIQISNKYYLTFFFSHNTKSKK